MMAWLFRGRRERELDEEIKTHLRMAVEERMSRGESQADAERAVRREFGKVGHVKEAARVVAVNWMIPVYVSYTLSPFRLSWFWFNAFPSRSVTSAPSSSRY